MVQDSATLTMETPEPHFHSSLEGAILLLHSSLPIQEVWEELKGWILILRSLLEALGPEEECLQEVSLEDLEASTMEGVPANKQRFKIKPYREENWYQLQWRGFKTYHHQETTGLWITFPKGTKQKGRSSCQF